MNVRGGTAEELKMGGKHGEKYSQFKLIIEGGVGLKQKPAGQVTSNSAGGQSVWCRTFGRCPQDRKLNG